MRLFVGIDLDKELKESLLEIQAVVKGMSISGRWKYIDNFHLTLKFLGEVEDHKIMEIDESLKKVSGQFRGAGLTIETMGCFWGKEDIRVVWLGMGGDLAFLRKLHTQIERSMEEIGFEREKRRFTPHITIAQDVRLIQPMEAVEKIMNGKLPLGFGVKDFHLFKSEQIGKHRVYTKLYTYNL